MHDLLKLNKDLKNYLDRSTPQMLSDLKGILQDDSILYLQGKSRKEAGALYVEYEYDYLDMVYWLADKSGEIISQTQVLPTKKNSKNDEQSKWNSFMPEDIWAKLADVQDEDLDQDLEDLLDEYNDEKYRIFEDWFCSCWKKAVEETGIGIDAYFSIHDTIFKTDLNTLEEIQEEDIKKRYL